MIYIYIYVSYFSNLSTTYAYFIWALLWLSSVCWAIKLNTPKWDILETGVAVYLKASFESLNSKHTEVLAQQR